MTYSDKLKSPKWQKRRLDILERDKFLCQDCYDSESELHVHHKIYKYGKDIWDYQDSELITLCKLCHTEVTNIKKNVKIIIDNNFVLLDELNELNGILEIISIFNPYDLMMIKKLCKNYHNKKVKQFYKDK